MHDKLIIQKHFQPRQKVLLYNSRLYLFLGNWNFVGNVPTLFIKFTYMA